VTLGRRLLARRPVTRCLSLAAAVALLLLALDGLAGFLVAGAVFLDPASAVSHTRYDPLLGWAGRPSLDLPDYYAPGVGLRTNSRGMRGAEVAERKDPGRVRVLCLGDSFTFGHGVADDQTWPAVVSRLDRRLEMVNMGQEGYGVDQMYLWYLRDGRSIDHDVLIVAFIQQDLMRAAMPDFFGYPKPVLVERDGRLAPERSELPRRSRLSGVRSLVSSARLLRSVSIPAGWFGSGASHSGEFVVDLARVHTIGMRVFSEIAEECRRNGRQALFLYLPSLEDAASAGNASSLRIPLQRWMAAKGYPYLDLTGDFAALPRWRRDALFLDEGHQLIHSIHYNADGHAFVASLVDRELHGGGRR
jgi:hypothetical protein